MLTASEAIVHIGTALEDTGLDASTSSAVVTLILIDYGLSKRHAQWILGGLGQALPDADLSVAGLQEATLREGFYAATFMVNSANRMMHGSTPAREQHYLRLHNEAKQARRDAGDAADRMAEIHGDILSWRAVRDGRTTPDCAAADGKNFSVSEPPLMGFPGGVHPYCRCTAGPPIEGAQTIPGERPT